MMDKFHKLSIIFLFVVLLTACQEPETVSFEEICNTANQKKNVVVDGYFSLGASVYCSDISGERRCGLVFNRYPDGDLELSVEVMEGWRKNRMIPLESGYLEEDLQIKTSDGSMIGVGDHVQVSGELLVTEDVCLMYVNKIETFAEE